MKTTRKKAKQSYQMKISLIGSECGGIGGYYEMLKTVKNPDHPDYEEKSVWLGSFDPKKFDLKYVNSSLNAFAKDPDAEWSGGG